MATGKSNVAHRRAVRAVEAKRDKLIENTARNRNELAKVRAELKSIKKRRV